MLNFFKVHHFFFTKLYNESKNVLLRRLCVMRIKGNSTLFSFMLNCVTNYIFIQHCILNEKYPDCQRNDWHVISLPDYFLFANVKRLCSFTFFLIQSYNWNKFSWTTFFFEYFFYFFSSFQWMKFFYLKWNRTRDVM